MYRGPIIYSYKVVFYFYTIYIYLLVAASATFTAIVAAIKDGKKLAAVESIAVATFLMYGGAIARSIFATKQAQALFYANAAYLKI